MDEKTEKVQALIAVIQEKTAIASVQQEQASIKQKYAEVGCKAQLCIEIVYFALFFISKYIFHRGHVK